MVDRSHTFGLGCCYPVTDNHDTSNSKAFIFLHLKPWAAYPSYALCVSVPCVNMHTCVKVYCVHLCHVHECAVSVCAVCEQPCVWAVRCICALAQNILSSPPCLAGLCSPFRSQLRCHSQPLLLLGWAVFQAPVHTCLDINFQLYGIKWTSNRCAKTFAEWNGREAVSVYFVIPFSRTLSSCPKMEVEIWFLNSNNSLDVDSQSLPRTTIMCMVSTDSR